MNYNILALPVFDKQVKHLSKKYPSFKSDLANFILDLSNDPSAGAVSLGNDFYKYRMSIRSKGKGKSGGARVITYFKILGDTIFLASIYDKSEIVSISDKELIELYKQIVNLK